MHDVPRVLIVEDDPGISKALFLRLRASGYDVVTASEGAGGIAAVVRHKPDLVLLDISMPAGGGFFVAENMRKRADARSTPIIFVTATRAPGIRERAESFGPAGYIEKPFDSAELVALVESVLGQDSADVVETSAPPRRRHLRLER